MNNIIIRFIKKNFSYIAKSSINAQGKISSSRISSFYLLIGILLMCVIFASIELGNAILSWKNGISYVVPGAHITIFGMILSHHLILLNLKRTGERDVMKYGNNVEPSGNQDNNQNN